MVLAVGRYSLNRVMTWFESQSTSCRSRHHMLPPQSASALVVKSTQVPMLGTVMHVKP